jgi:hypothetical protein
MLMNIVVYGAERRVGALVNDRSSISMRIGAAAARLLNFIEAGAPACKKLSV